MSVTPKKELGQHFLTDLTIAESIADLLTGHIPHADEPYRHLLEIGPGMGVLTQFLLQKSQFDTYVIEIDRESVDYLKQHIPQLEGRILSSDFLNIQSNYLPTKQPGSTGLFGIIGNFPYNISTQILFKVLDMRDRVPEVVGMFQREVAMRVASGPGNKDYGILSVLLQAWYDIKYEFTVEPEVFNPPPKVRSGVLSLRRNDKTELGCDERKFRQVVKHGFGQRRKTLRNALKPLNPSEAALASAFMDKRAEQLSVDQFVELTLLMTNNE
ncbi:MAG: 16S rRNA (adenine(1518)-N(6)/adenine(1519)-N(6))-dimethyltransferase RsmA [Spirosoma sp.]|nr:16S rRNA (adenine(1518)-N(6)/adenine(1519)-N(6))-dimethyltransferase RsmA [Spirosoma sp.]